MNSLSSDFVDLLIAHYGNRGENLKEIDLYKKKIIVNNHFCYVNLRTKSAQLSVSPTNTMLFVEFKLMDGFD